MASEIQLDLIIKTRTGTGTTPFTTYPSLSNIFSVGEYVGLSSTSIPTMAAPDPPVELPMARIAEGLFLYVKSDQVISIYTNDLANDPQVGKEFLLTSETGDGFTAVYVKNTSGSTAVVKYIIGGDPT